MVPPGNYYLVGGFKHHFYFPFRIWDVILAKLTNSIIFQGGRAQPPTSYTLGGLSMSMLVDWLFTSHGHVGLAKHKLRKVNPFLNLNCYGVLYPLEMAKLNPTTGQSSNVL